MPQAMPEATADANDFVVLSSAICGLIFIAEKLG
jgi:hypothetical protein